MGYGDYRHSGGSQAAYLGDYEGERIRVINEMKQIIKRNGEQLIKLMNELGLIDYNVNLEGIPFAFLGNIKRDLVANIMIAKDKEIEKEEEEKHQKKKKLEMWGKWDALEDEEKKKYLPSKQDWSLRVGTIGLVATGLIDAMIEAWNTLKKPDRGLTLPQFLLSEVEKERMKKRENELVSVER